MTEGHKNTWLSTALLLGSLMAGVFTTQLIPSYHEHEGKITYPSRAAAKAETPSDSAPGYSQASNRDPHITLVSHAE
jgi:hypothetical protein